MKKLRIPSLILSALLILAVFTGCSASKDSMGGENYAPEDGGNGYIGEVDYEMEEGTPDGNDPTADSLPLYENPFIDTSVQNISTFSADVDTASYTYFRKLAGQGYTLSELKTQISRSTLRT